MIICELFSLKMKIFVSYSGSLVGEAVVKFQLELIIIFLCRNYTFANFLHFSSPLSTFLRRPLELIKILPIFFQLAKNFALRVALTLSGILCLFTLIDLNLSIVFFFFVFSSFIVSSPIGCPWSVCCHSFPECFMIRNDGFVGIY